MTWPIEPFGDAALRIRRESPRGGRSLLRALRTLPGVVDAVVTEQHAMVTFEPASPPSADDLGRALQGADDEDADPPREHLVRVAYGGPDLATVASAASMTEEQVVEAHAGPTYVVALLGFMPGFAYLRGLDDRLRVPRRAAPRTHVPTGSLAVAGPYTGIYPFAGPGGWNLIGVAIDFVAFDPRTGATMGLGDRVRFVAEET